MRKFNLLEKEFISKMVDHPMLINDGVLRTSVFLDSTYVGPNHKISLLFSAQKKMVIVSFPKEGNESNQALILIMTFFLLLRDLEKEGLLCCTGDSSFLNSALGTQYNTGKNVSLSSDLIPIANKYFDNILLISEDLKDLVKNDFKSREEIKYKQTMVLAVGALIVSVLLGLWGVLKDQIV